MSDFRILFLNRENRLQYENGIRELEAIARYPFGTDFFRIDHGPDYFKFFDRLGILVSCIAVTQTDDIVAVASGVIRNLNGIRTWYLCDLKVHPDYRGRHLAVKLLTKGFVRFYPKAQRGYLVSMNPPDGTPNRVLKIIDRFQLALFSEACQLEFFSFSVDEFERYHSLMEFHRGPISLLSLRGIKDLILESTQRPMNLWHLHHGTSTRDHAVCLSKDEFRRIANSELGDVTILFCSPQYDQLNRELKDSGKGFDATASVLQHRMKKFDWSQIMTSEI